MALACASRPEFHHVVVALHKRHHTQKHNQLGAVGEFGWFKSDGTDEEVAPLFRRETAPPFRQNFQRLRLGELDRPKRLDGKRPSAIFLSDDRVVTQRHLRVEAIRQHPLVFFHQRVADAHVLQCEAWHFCHVAIVLCVQSRPHDVDQLYGAGFARLRLEQLFLSSADGTVIQLLLDDLQPFPDFAFVNSRAIPAQEELNDIRRHGVLPTVFPHQVFAHQIAIKG